MLQEILRVEPVVGHLFRRTLEPLTVQLPDGDMTIPAGELIDLHILHLNADPDVVGQEPGMVCPGRDTGRISPAVMGFGDGHHRCPGAHVALQETDIFLQRLLALQELHLVQDPKITWNELVQGYEIRDFIISI